MSDASRGVRWLSIACLVFTLSACGDDDTNSRRDASSADAGERDAAPSAGDAGRDQAGGGAGSSSAVDTPDAGHVAAATTCGAPATPAAKPGNQCPAEDPVALKATLVGTDFDVAVFVTALPGSEPRLAVLERAGTIQLLDPATGNKSLFLDFEARKRGLDIIAATAPAGEQGLLGLAFHPDFPNDPRLFVNYTARAGAQDVTVISSFEVMAGDPERVNAASEQSVLEFGQPQGNHNGGMLAFGPDGCLFAGSGDGGQSNDVGDGHAPGGNGQSLATDLGKILRIDVDRPLERPTGNLQDTDLPHIWDYGTRNPWRFSFDRLTGDLYIGDVGQGAFEEIDVAAAGVGNLNYGWPIMEGSWCRDGEECDQSGLVLPVDQYETGEGHNAVIGGYVYRGEKIPSLRGWYVYGDNGAASNGKVAAFVWNGRGRCKDRTLQLQERDELALDSDITSLGQDAEGELYVVTRRSVYRLEAK